MHTMISKRTIRTSLSVLAVVWAGAAAAQDAAPKAATAADPAASAGENITVTGWRLRQLDVAASTASRLNLSVRETPATIDQISANEILTRGIRTVEEAVDTLPGVISGGTPGDPSLFSMRGFSAE